MSTKKNNRQVKNGSNLLHQEIPEKSNSVQMKEYELLKSEIMQKIQMQNTLVASMVTAVVAVLAFSLKETELNPWMFLIPQFIIIPISNRYAYYRKNIAKISSYMIYYLEKDHLGFQWETRNREMEIHCNENKAFGAFIRNSEFLAMSVVSAGFNIVVMFQGISLESPIKSIIYALSQDYLKILNLALIVLSIAVELYITIDMSNIRKKRDNSVFDWAEIS